MTHLQEIKLQGTKDRDENPKHVVVYQQELQSHEVTGILQSIMLHFPEFVLKGFWLVQLEFTSTVAVMFNDPRVKW